jgi:Fe-S cluster biogenesis protein NfuA
MSTDVTTEPLERRLHRFMSRNFPQIAMHGGTAGIEGIDEETGEVWVSLGGACSGCGISPMTVQALQARMVAEFDEVSEVHATTGGFDAGFGYGAGTGDDDRPDVSDAPF